MSWGGHSGTRAVEQLRLVTIELDMAPLRAAVHLPTPPWLVKTVEDLDTDATRRSAETMLDQLTWWAGALRTAKQADAT